MSDAFSAFVTVMFALYPVLWLSSKVLNRRKKLFVENAKFVLAKPKSAEWGNDFDFLEVIPRESFIVDRVEEGKSPFQFRVIRPELAGLYRKRSVKKDTKGIAPGRKPTPPGRIPTDRTEVKLYDLELTEEIYNLYEIIIPKDDYPNFKNWQEIGEMLRETWRIDANISEYRIMIAKIRTAIPFAAASNVYSGYVSRYEQSIRELGNEIKSGERFGEELKQLVREYLLGMELSGIDPIEVINEVDRSRQKNKELGSDLKDRYSSLLRDAEVYLSTIDEYSEIMESLRNL